MNTDRDETPILLSPRHGKCQGYQALGQKNTRIRGYNMPVTEEKSNNHSTSGNINKSQISGLSERELGFADRVDRIGK